MKPSEKCKAAGLKSLAELSEITGESVQTLNNWNKNKPHFFEIVLAGAIVVKKQNKGGSVKIAARDVFSGDVVELTATLTTDHSVSSYGQPVMVIKEWADQDSDLMGYDNWVLAGCSVVEPGDKEQQELFAQWIKNMAQMLGQ